MLTAADRADQAEWDDRTDPAEVADGDDWADQDDWAERLENSVCFYCFEPTFVFLAFYWLQELIKILNYACMWKRGNCPHPTYTYVYPGGPES